MSGGGQQQDFYAFQPAALGADLPQFDAAGHLEWLKTCPGAFKSNPHYWARGIDPCSDTILGLIKQCGIVINPNDRNWATCGLLHPGGAPASGAWPAGTDTTSASPGSAAAGEAAGWLKANWKPVAIVSVAVIGAALAWRARRAA